MAVWGDQEPWEASPVLGRPETLGIPFPSGLLAGLMLRFPLSLDTDFVLSAFSLWRFLSSLPPCPSPFFILSSVSPAATQSLPSQAFPLSVCLTVSGSASPFFAAYRLRAGRGQMGAGQVLGIHPSHEGGGVRTGRRSPWPLNSAPSCCWP